MQYIIITFAVFFALRLVSLSYSIRNEKRLISKGGVQYGKKNSLLLTLAHIAYYFSALYEAYARGIEFNTLSAWGVGVMAFAYVMLFYVIYKLHDIWTVKLSSYRTKGSTRASSSRSYVTPTTSSTSSPNSSVSPSSATPGTPSPSVCPSMPASLPSVSVRKRWR